MAAFPLACVIHDESRFRRCSVRAGLVITIRGCREVRETLLLSWKNSAIEVAIAESPPG
jgi:hypothetical protein